MPEVPEALPAPASLGGLLPHLAKEVDEEQTLSGLSERTAEMTEDIEAYQEVAGAVREAEQESSIEEVQEEVEERQ